MTHVAVATNASELRFGFEQRRTDPALDHGATSPALDVAGVVLHCAVEILDRVGSSKRTLQRTGEAQTLDGKCLLQALAYRGGGAGMVALQGTREALELTLGQLGRFGIPRIVKRSGDARVHRLGQMPLSELDKNLHKARGETDWWAFLGVRQDALEETLPKLRQIARKDLKLK